MALAVGSVLAPAAAGPARADTPGCVSEGEYLRVAHGMAKATVHRIFDIKGRFLDGGAGGYARGYRQCGADPELVVVVYAATDTSAHVAQKSWRNPDRGDVRVRQGTKKADSFDLSGPVRRDHLYAGDGDDYVFMKPDGYRDVIRCGPGVDLVQWLRARERRDVYRGCEHVVRYSP